MGVHLDARRRLIGQMGRPLTLRRLVANGSPVDLTVRGFEHAPSPTDVARGAQQNDMVFEILHDEIAAAAWPHPVRQNDKLIEGTRIVTAQGAWAVHEGATIIGWKIPARG